MRFLLLATAVVAAGLLVGTARAAQPPDPCVLITNVDASTALGSTPPQTKSKIVAGVRTCTYTVKKKSMSVQATKVATQSAFDKSVKKNKGLVIPIQGVGADAWSANGTKLLVWENGFAITMTFTGFEPFVATQQSLAKTALGRLP